MFGGVGAAGAGWAPPQKRKKPESGSGGEDTFVKTLPMIRGVLEQRGKSS